MLTIPGNLLLLGEYAVLEPGGLGIAMAVERRVVLEVKAGEESGSESGSESGASSLVSETIRAVARELAARGKRAIRSTPGLRFDSSALFGADGKKLGLGSSAAVAVGTAFALLTDAGLEGEELMGATLRAALEGHRSFQGGRGSGYDVAASLYGGLGLFVGGERPSFKRLEPMVMPPLYLVRGPAPVDTARAIGRYAEWKTRNPAAASSFLEASNEIARGFAVAESWAAASSRLREAARLASLLGESIGVPARVYGIDGLGGDNGVAKALGAGDELIGVWRVDAPEESCMTVEISDAGPLWSA